MTLKYQDSLKIYYITVMHLWVNSRLNYCCYKLCCLPSWNKDTQECGLKAWSGAGRLLWPISWA